MLKDDLWEACRKLNYSRETAKTYWGWSESFLRWAKDRASEWVHPSKLHTADVEEYLTHLAVDGNVAASTQTQALNALNFLYRHVLDRPLGNLDAVRAKRPKRLPVVLSVDEVQRLLAEMVPPWSTIAAVMYGGGLRVGKAVNIRIKDVDFDRGQIVLREAKGDKDRYTLLPDSVVPALREQIAIVEEYHRKDVRDGCARVELPGAFNRKSRHASSDLLWYFVFASPRRSRSPDTGLIGRHHLHKGAAASAIKQAARAAGIKKRVTSHALRHSFATHLLEAGYSIETVRDLMGHKDIRTTSVYLHCVTPAVTRTVSPLDSSSTLRHVLAKGPTKKRQRRTG